MAGIDELLTVARAYAELAGVSLTTVSSRAFDDGKKLGAIEAGADIQSRRLDRALQWFSDNWPAGDWPETVFRPTPSVAPSPESREVRT